MWLVNRRIFLRVNKITGENLLRRRIAAGVFLRKRERASLEEVRKRSVYDLLACS